MQFEEQIRGLPKKSVEGKNFLYFTHYCSLLIIIAAGIYLRYSFLFRPIKYDEAWSFNRWASQSFAFIVKDYSAPNNHILHTILMRISYLTLGMEPWKLRMPAFIAGVLIIPAAYLLFRLLYDKSTALLASGLIASSSFLIEFSVNARGYTLITLFFLLIFSLAYYLINNHSLWAWLAFALLSALGFYTIPVFIYPFGTVCLWSFLSLLKEVNEEKNKRLFLLFFFVLLTFLLTFLLYLPVIKFSGLDALIANQFVKPLPWDKFLPEFYASIIPNLKLFHWDMPKLHQFLLLAGFFLALIFHKKIASHKVPIVYTALGFTISVIIIQKVVPYNRIYIFFFPLYYGLASAGLYFSFQKLTSIFKNEGIKELTFSFFTLIFTLTLGISAIFYQSVYYSDFTGSFRDGEKVTLYIKSRLKPEDKILVYCPIDHVLFYYFKYYNQPLSHFFSLRKNQAMLVPWRKIEPLGNLEARLKKRGFNIQDYQIKLIKGFEESNLFLLEPKSSNR